MIDKNREGTVLYKIQLVADNNWCIHIVKGIAQGDASFIIYCTCTANHNAKRHSVQCEQAVFEDPCKTSQLKNVSQPWTAPTQSRIPPNATALRISSTMEVVRANHWTPDINKAQAKPNRVSVNKHSQGGFHSRTQNRSKIFCRYFGQQVMPPIDVSVLEHALTIT